MKKYVPDELLVEKTKNEILRRALRLSSQCVSDLLDQLDVENFGADTHYSVALAEAAVSVGLANKGDSAFDLDGITLEQAKATDLFMVFEKLCPGPQP